MRCEPALIKSFIKSYFLATLEKISATKPDFFSLSTFLKPKSVFCDMLLSEFDFNLPSELIAQNPLSERGKTKLLVYQNDKISDSNFSNLTDFLQEEDVLVFNDVKVIKAKLYGKIARNSSKIEFNLDQEIFNHQLKNNKNRIWRVICKGAKKLKENDEIIFADDFFARIITKFDDGFCIIEFAEDLDQKLEKYGEVPLPPYIKRENGTKSEDEQNYQTIYAKKGSAVAAPTAGLHFSKEIFQKLQEKNIKKAFVTLNVGAGTFLPVRSEKIKDHKMHEESFEILQESVDIINNAKKNNNRIISVGTTSLRVLESVSDENGMLKQFRGTTDIFIYPGYKFKNANALITNFHLPKSTLFMLICAAIGKDEAYKVYNHAINKKYRFFSYGDSSLLEFKK